MKVEFQGSVKSQIEKNYFKTTFGVDVLASLMAMDRVTLYRKCLRVYGKSPQKIIEEFRLNRAALVLKNEELSVKAVAQATGFVYEKYFSKRFKKHFGAPPTEYRKQLSTQTEQELVAV